MTVIERTYELPERWRFLEPANGQWEKPENQYLIKLKDGDTYRCHFKIQPEKRIDILDFRWHNICSPQGTGYGLVKRFFVKEGLRVPVNLWEGGKYLAWSSAGQTGTNYILLHDDEFHEIGSGFDMDYVFNAIQPAGAELWLKTVESYLVFEA